MFHQRRQHLSIIFSSSAEIQLPIKINSFWISPDTKRRTDQLTADILQSLGDYKNCARLWQSGKGAQSSIICASHVWSETSQSTRVPVRPTAHSWQIKWQKPESTELTLKLWCSWVRHCVFYLSRCHWSKSHRNRAACWAEKMFRKW